MLLIEGFLVGGCAGLVAIVYRRLLSWAEEAVMWISTQLRADLLWLPLVLVMLVLIGVLLAGTLLTAAFSRMIVRPIKRMSGAAEMVRRWKQEYRMMV